MSKKPARLAPPSRKPRIYALKGGTVALLPLSSQITLEIRYPKDDVNGVTAALSLDRGVGSPVLSLNNVGKHWIRKDASIKEVLWQWQELFGLRNTPFQFDGANRKQWPERYLREEA